MIGELKLEEGTYFDFLTHHPTTAAVTDADSGPTAEVFEDATDTTVVALVVTKRTSKTGNYRVPVTAAAADGFEVGKTYNVIASATVNSIAGKGVIGRFKVRARGKDDLAIESSLQALITTVGAAGAGLTATVTAVWAAATRLLTAGTNIVLAKGTGVTGFNDLSAAQVNTEADTALADVGVTGTVTGRIDATVSSRASQVTADAIDAKTTNLPSDPADQSLVIAATTALASAIAALNNLSAAQVNTEVDTAITDAALATAANLALAKTAIDAVKAKTDLLPEGLKKNTALPNFPFPMLLASDHVTGATGLTITATRKIDGGSFAACANAATEVGNGVYVINLAAADMNGDVIMLRFTAATADDRLITLKTSP